MAAVDPLQVQFWRRGTHEATSRFRYLVVTQESVSATSRRVPTQPGRVVLQGQLNLG